MKVMVIGSVSRAPEAGEMRPVEMFKAMDKFNKELINTGMLIVGEGLTPSFCGARVQFAGAYRIVTDRPLAEPTELIAGFSIWKVSSL